MLKPADVKADAAWRFPIIVCASNYERVLFNFLQAKRFAKAHGEPLLFWYKPFRHISSQRVHKLNRSHYYSDNRRSKKLAVSLPELQGFFVRGAPCYILDPSLNASKTSIVNGTKGIMHSITFESDYQFDREQYQPGEVVEVDVPYSVNVLVQDEVTEENPTPRAVIVPNVAKDLEQKIPARLLGLKGQAKKRRIRAHHVAIGFAVTFHKIQGKTADKLLVVLNKRVGRLFKITFEGLYVVTTRVKRACDLKVWPVDRDDLDYLLKLKHHPHLNLWDINHDKNGHWIKKGLKTIRDNDKKSVMTQFQRILQRKQTLTVKQLQVFAKILYCYKSKDDKETMVLKLRQKLVTAGYTIPPHVSSQWTRKRKAASQKNKASNKQKKSKK